MKLTAILRGAVAALALTLAGCSSPMSPPGASGAAGTVTFTIGGGERAVLPSLGQFEKITLGFAGRNGAENLADADITAGSATVSITAAGSWDVTARAYLDGAEDAVAISNTQTISWSGPGTNVSGETWFVLGPAAEATEPGTLRYAVALAGDIVLGAGSRIRLEQAGGAFTPADGGFADGEKGISGSVEAAVTVPAGRYAVDILIVRGDGKVAAYRETAEVLPGLSTALVFAPANGGFIDPAVAAAVTGIDGLVFAATIDGGSIVSGGMVFSNDPPSLAITADVGAQAARFTLTKGADQEAAVSGADKESVELVAAGNAAGGSTASAGLAVFVAGGLDQGSREFVITVTEPGTGKAGVEMAVTVTPKAAAPAADPAPGETAVRNGDRVTLSTATTGAKIYYTTNGGAPDAGDTEYTGPIVLSEGTFTITAIAIKEGWADSGALTASYEVGPPWGGLTAGIEFVATDSHSAGLTAEQPTIVDATHEEWAWTVTEKAEISFGVWKEAGQTVTVANADTGVSAADASVTANGGDEAGDELALFTVNTERWDAATRTSTMFYGTGSHTVKESKGNVADTDRTLTFAPFTFDLVVSEPNHDSKTVSVTVSVETDPTGVAVFKAANNSLERVPAGDIRKWTDTTQQGNRLIDAIAWIDDYNTAGEYLVRVENSEAIPKSYITCDSTVEIRLRGYGNGEKVISHDGNKPVNSPSATNTVGYCHSRQFSLSGNWGSLYGMITLSSTHLTLEDKITIKGLGFDATPPSKSADYIYRNLILGAVITMRAGSRITGHNASLSLNYSVLKGQFFMEGGSIDHNKVAKAASGTSHGTLLYIQSDGSLIGYTTLEQHKPFCVKTGGTVTDNVRIDKTNNTEEVNFIKVYVGATDATEADITVFEQ